MAPSMSTSPTATANATTANPATLNAAAAEEARYFAKSVATWFINTIDPYAPHARNVESRLRHPLHVVTRRILYGNVHLGGDGDDDDLEALFNDDDAEIKDGWPETLTRRSAARMEAFLAGCSAALREDHPLGGEGGDHRVGSGNVGDGVAPVEDGGMGKDAGGGGGDGKKKRNKKREPLDKTSVVARTRPPSSSSKPRRFRQIDLGDLLLRLEVYCRTLRRIRSLSDANPSGPMEECVIQREPKKQIRARIGLIVQTYLRNVDCVRDVHTTLMTLVLTATLEVLAVEVWCPELRTTVDRLASEYEHKVSFASLAFLSSPDNSAGTHLVPLLTKYFEYLQTDWEALVSKCELERMLTAVLDDDLRHHFKTAVFHSVGHILDECRRERASLDNIALPPPWKEGVFGVAGGGDTSADVDSAMKQYFSDPALVKQALRDLRREVITVNGQILPQAQSHMELAEHLGRILHSNSELCLSPRITKKKGRRRASNYASDFGLELESDLSGVESEASLVSKVDVGLVDALAMRLLVAASRTGAGGDAYFIVRDLFGGDEVEVVPHHSSSGKVNQGSIEIVVKLSGVLIKSHAKFDIFPKPIVSDSDALIQFHTTTTETISLQQSRVASFTTLKEKKSNMTGWRTLAIRPAYYKVAS
ncbi:hypothetical protein ACHAW5_009315 [Stephanodiscus triporus]|uniref:MHD2 domain-containing protein n=1 Tax=Stephanodiscus triporus TaxID=2934178 RepID=A0ABD3QRW9_9STRA